MLRRLIRENIQIIIQVTPGIPLIQGDAGRLQQVIMNLCLNARDAMPQGGTLSIQVDQVHLEEREASQILHARPGDYVRLSVSDTGVGIPPEHIERIFEPFFTTKPAGEGTGLGLSVAYSIVQEHGGWINVYSEVGRGTTFRLYFPAFSEPSETANRASHPAKGLEKSTGQGERILLVEDEDNVRNLTTAVLESQGYVVYPAATFAEALAFAQEHKGEIDLLVSDQVLPDGTGLALAEWLRSLQPHLAVLIASGYHSLEQRTGREEGYAFIPKPYNMHEILEAVRRALDHARSKDEREG